MSARQKNQHRSRHRTHAVKPANLTHTSLAKTAPPAGDAPNPIQAENVDHGTARNTRKRDVNRE